MGLGNNVWVRATPETTYGAYDSTQASNALWFRLFGNTAFSMQSDPKVQVLMSADSYARPVTNISNRAAVGGKLRTPIYQSQAAALLAFATTVTSGNLPSYTFDWYDSVNVERYLGVMCNQIDLTCSSDGDEGVLYGDLTLVGQQLGTAPTLTQPAATVFPTELPYAHQDSRSGGFTIGGLARSAYNKFSCSIKNTLIGTFDELPYITNLLYAGRTVSFSTDFQYLSAADRTAYEAQTAQAAAITFTRGAHTLGLNFEGQARITKRTRALPVGGVSRQALDFTAFLDTTATADFAFTTT